MSDSNGSNRDPRHSSLVRVSPRARVGTLGSYSRPHSEPPEPSHDTDLRLYARIVRNRWRLGASVFVLTLGAVGLGTWLQDPVYRATGTMEIRRQTEQVVPAEAAFQQARITDQHLETEYQVLTSPALAQRVTHELRQAAALQTQSDPAASGAESFSEEALEDAIKGFRGRLIVDPLRGSRLVRVSFESEDPELAAKVVNLVFVHYTQLRVEAARTAEQHLATQADSVRLQLVTTEQQLHEYMRANGLLFLESGSGNSENIVHERLRQLQQQLTQAETERYARQSQYNLIQQQGTETLQNDAVRALSLQIAELRGEYARLRSTFTEDYPRAQQLKSQLDDLEAQLARERRRMGAQINREYFAAVRNQELLRDAFVEQQQRIDQLADRTAEYHRLQRNLSSHQNLHALLQQRRQEAGVATALAATEVGVVDWAAAPGLPIRPVPKRNMQLGLIVGLLLGMGSIFVREYTSNTVNTVEELDTLSSHPVLGVIPSVSSADPVRDRGATFTEAFGNLRTSILLSIKNPPPRTLIVTSAQPNDGKTTISVNLARSLASLGGHVLLVDADLRRPSLHSAIGFSAAAGLAEYLNDALPWRTAVLPQVAPGLDVLPAGQPPMNAAELLASSRMKQLVQETRAEYDFVIFDSPAVLINAADARILAPLMEGSIVVIRRGATPRDLARRAIQQVPNVVGVVLNDLELREFTSYYGQYSSDGDAAPSATEMLPSST
jgi:polysaccharide biosynthesis transport protein